MHEQARCDSCGDQLITHPAGVLTRLTPVEYTYFPNALIIFAQLHLKAFVDEI